MYFYATTNRLHSLHRSVVGPYFPNCVSRNPRYYLKVLLPKVWGLICLPSETSLDRINGLCLLGFYLETNFLSWREDSSRLTFLEEQFYLSSLPQTTPNVLSEMRFYLLAFSCGAQPWLALLARRSCVDMVDSVPAEDTPMLKLTSLASKEWISKSNKNSNFNIMNNAYINLLHLLHRLIVYHNFLGNSLGSFVEDLPKSWLPLGMIV